MISPAVGRLGGQMARQRLRAVGQFIRRYHLPDHAPRQCLLGADFVTQHGHAHRAGVAGQPRQEPAAAGVRHQPQTAERLNEAGIVGGDDDIARGASAAPAPAATPLTAHTTGFGRAVRRRIRVVETFDRQTEIRRLLIGADVAIVEILPGAETAPGAGDQQAAHAVVALGLRQRFAQLAMHLIVKAVEPIRPVEVSVNTPALRWLRINALSINQRP